ncbi:type ISP restriction/modification enzyme [Kineococcus terrestris]|uniref:type ISP restriction/modification enzyme n=1 Tax=Kineococcus terrestris TaxID=2044856 RepID=UPI0034DB5D2F
MSWLGQEVAEFGRECRQKLAVPGVGDPEAQIRGPLERLLGAVGRALGVQAIFHDEVRDTERRVRPDYGVRVDGAITGYIEVKAPGRGIDPERFTGHDKAQWERLRDLPNLLYTNGVQWRLFQNGAPVTVDGASAAPVTFSASLDPSDTIELSAPATFQALMGAFLDWRPAPITSVGALVRAVAPLTRALRGEVLDQIAAEDAALAAGAEADSQPFRGLAGDWRALLFPLADDATFADGYAQTVTFALLLARTEGVTLDGVGLHEVGGRLSAGHSLMGRALQVLTDHVARDFKVTLDLLVRVIGAVDWSRVRRGRRDTYLFLYEDFLDVYDNDLRKKSGSYYTPQQVVADMVRLTEEVLKTRLGIGAGFLDDRVTTVDPAMGTGTYLQTILERCAQQIADLDGPGAVPAALGAAATRLVGFEIQTGPYAVAELRIADLLRTYGAAAAVPSPSAAGRGEHGTGVRLYLTDTLDDPLAEQTQIGAGLQLIAASRRAANRVKSDANVTVVIGNPPYDENAAGRGGWVEQGVTGTGTAAPMNDFRIPGDGVYAQNLKNMYAYFWRWATWKVWESTPTASDTGVVCFITPAAYIDGPAYQGMRNYIRRWASEGWILDLTPEGQTPPVQTRIFPGVRQPLAIGLFVRRPGTSNDIPAALKTRALQGRQREKFAQLSAISLHDEQWIPTRTGWTDRFTPAAAGAWDTWPTMDDVLPWTSSGVTPNRTWVYSPSRAALMQRWQAVVGEGDPERKQALFKETPTAKLAAVRDPLPGSDVHQGQGPFNAEISREPALVQVTYRSFDRQWVIADSRTMHRPRPTLWAARIPGQVFIIEQHAHSFGAGPSLLFSHLIPDMHTFNNRGGRALPLLHADGTANLAPGLLSALATHLDEPVSADDVAAYLAALTAHPGFRNTFAMQMREPGVRVPFSAEPALWRRAIALGRHVIWAHTYGTRFADPAQGRAENNVRLPAESAARPLLRTPVTSMPTAMAYDPQAQTITFGGGEVGPVAQAVWDYTVGGRNVVKSWFDYRKADPGGRRSSPLDDINPAAWEAQWSSDLLDLLSILTRLVELEDDQQQLLDAVLAAPVLTRAELAAQDVHWPQASSDRAARTATPLSDPDTLDFGL